MTLDPHPQEIIDLRDAAERARQIASDRTPCKECDGMRSFAVQRMQGGDMVEEWQACPRCGGEGFEP